ncbi:MAG: nitronate monooxygenase [Deltaproteobacteria bacterium HGW-Deltaproteobacteria-12]|jgi:nitronate monooxygenase|nr:MAG: nitronate monooxygenase [Deltaproteobacteria bacterium HGW-Deltaproteobacteria-12]
MFKTRMTEVLNIEYPIMQGGMMWISRAELTSAVSNAGGLGTMTALTFSAPQDLAAEIRKAKQLTKNTFAVNVTILPTFREVNYDGYIDVIIGEGVQAVETAGNNPERVIGRLKNAGIKIIHKCTTVRHALKAVELGCDIISIDGFECAGHPGEDDVGGLVLIPVAVNALKVPVIASGGIGNARGFVAALALGAEGVNMGTRFLLTKESPIHQNVKDWLLKFTERDTMLLLRAFHNTERVVRTERSEKALEIELSGAGIEALQPIISGVKGLEMIEQGIVDNGIMTVGQCIGLINEIPTVKEVIDNMISEADQIIKGRLLSIAQK